MVSIGSYLRGFSCASGAASPTLLRLCKRRCRWVGARGLTLREPRDLCRLTFQRTSLCVLGRVFACDTSISICETMGCSGQCGFI